MARKKADNKIKTKKAIWIGDDEAFKKGQEVDVVERIPKIGYKVQHPFRSWDEETFIIFDHEVVKPRAA